MVGSWEHAVVEHDEKQGNRFTRITVSSFALLKQENTLIPVHAVFPVELPVYPVKQLPQLVVEVPPFRFKPEHTAIIKHPHVAVRIRIVRISG